MGTCDGGCPFICPSAHEPTWLKIRNRSYSQWVGREELFERERGGDSDFRGGTCVRGCVPLSPDSLFCSNLDDLARLIFRVLDSD